MDMCERNSLNPGYVSSLLNFAPPESLYFSNLRGNGSHIPGLHQLPYNRREVCTLPWTSTSNSCTAGPPAAPQNRAFGAYCPPFFSSSALLNSGPSGAPVRTHLEDPARCFQGTNHKTEEAGGQDEVFAGEHGGAGDRGYSDVDRSHSSAAQLDPDSAAPLRVNGTKLDPSLTHGPSSQTCSRTTLEEGLMAVHSTNSYLIPAV